MSSFCRTYSKKFLLLLAFFYGLLIPGYGQKIKRYDLRELLWANQLELTASYPQIYPTDASMKEAINVRGILWLKNVEFETGTIDVDLRGRNVFLKNFLGIAFHAKDTNNYDVVYFCPFRFHDSAAETRKYSVKYMSVPDYSYTKLRKDFPGLYENEVNPAPQSDEWFHASIVVDKEWITVYVNHSGNPSLRAKKLPTFSSGKIGLWSYSETLSSDFANLEIKQ